jgi:hypothetical protein
LPDWQKPNRCLAGRLKQSASATAPRPDEHRTELGQRRTVFEDDRRLCVLRSKIKKPAGRVSDGSIFQQESHLPVTCRARQPIGSEHECRSKAPAPSRLEDAQMRLCGSRLCLILQFMHKGKTGASGYLVGTGFMSSPPQWK